MLMFGVYFVLTSLVLLGFWLVSKQICWRECVTQFVVQSLVILGMCFLIMTSSLQDQEYITGRVVSKARDQVHCKHSYQCHCVRTRRGSRCSTCYEHGYDVVWFAETDLPKRFYIRSVDRQGIFTPPHWATLVKGSPMTHAISYENYIKADPDSLFASDASSVNKADFIPYPNNIYEEYKLNRFLGDSVKNTPKANELLAELNADIGPKTKANVILYTTSKPKDYAKQLQRAWEGGKQNDIIIVAGVKKSVIQWVDVIGLSYPDFKVKLRNVIQNHQKIDAQLFPKIRDTILAHYKIREMSDFKYLQESFKPTLLQWILGAMISLLVSVGLGFFFHKVETFPLVKKNR
ncbi:MAG: hypothetical protein LW809_02470 [Vampirovibrionales bacterium]|jgi:hypothetical protein|nr:hypothetical protein [Vampirovibrionales bacterium]